MHIKMADYDASAPLLTRMRGEAHPAYISQAWTETRAGFTSWIKDVRVRGRRLLTSRDSNYFLLSLVAVDGAILLFKVFLQLIACEMHQGHQLWVVEALESLDTIGFLFSTFFLLELVVSVVSFGLVYVTRSFNVFDALVILFSFAISIGTRGTVRSIGSLIIVSRLLRLAKMSEEMVLEAAERVRGLEQRNVELSDEVKLLREELGLTHTTEV